MITRITMIWTAVLASEIIYFVVLVLLAATASDSNEPVFTKIQNWTGFSVGGLQESFTPLLLIFLFVSIAIGVVVALFSEKWMRASDSLQSFLQRLMAGTSIAGVPGIFGLIYGLMTGKLTYAGLLLGISFVLKLKFYPGLYADQFKQYDTIQTQ